MSSASDWFPGGQANTKGWRLDIVSLLAVLGDSAVATHAQELTASWLCLLPRPIPAPQALLRSSRPRRLPALNANVTGVESASQVEEIPFFANIIHDIDDLRPHEFRQYEIKYNVKQEDQVLASSKLSKEGSVEQGQAPRKPPPMVPPSRSSPMHWVSAVSCGLSIGAIIWAGIIHDGIALIAIAFISIASSMIGLGLWWHPVLAQRPSSGEVPPGDVMIRTRNGAFIYVKCDEQIARELYFGTERCDYYLKDTNLFRAFSGTGTLLLMVSVVLLGNCSWTMQAVVGGIYLLLNLFYWLISILEKKRFWSLHRYSITPINLNQPPFCDIHVVDKHGHPASYTRPLWYAIWAAQSTKWVIKSRAVPSTDAWNKWLDDAQLHLHDKNWDAVYAKDIYMAEAAQNLRRKNEDTTRMRIANANANANAHANE